MKRKKPENFLDKEVFWYNKSSNSILGGFTMADRSRFLRDNPSDFPYDFENKSYPKRLLTQSIIVILN